MAGALSVYCRDCTSSIGGGALQLASGRTKVRADSEDRPLVLGIDGNSLIYRAYFALPDSIRNPLGQPINAVQGFVSMLTKLLREHSPDDVVVACDSEWPTLRHKMHKKYKGNRSELPTDLINQVPWIQALLRDVGIICISVPGYEADDILGSLARTCIARAAQALIVSGDRDLVQLVSDPLVRVLYTRRGVDNQQILDEAGVLALTGVTPSRYPEFAALRGDASDNIPGIRGVGPKTAEKIVATAPSLDILYKDLSPLGPRLAHQLLTDQDTVYRNLELTRIKDRLPIDWKKEELLSPRQRSTSTPDLEQSGLIEFYDKLTAEMGASDSKRETEATAKIQSPCNDPNPAGSGVVCLIGCSSDKRSVPSSAAELYTSQRFRLARQWAERNSQSWFILSARHGLVPPDTRLNPYDLALKDSSPGRQRAWARDVVSKLVDRTSTTDPVYVFSDPLYSDLIEAPLIGKGYRVAKPLDGMTSDQRIRWLTVHTSLGRKSGDLEELYQILYWLSLQTDGPQPLSQSRGESSQGVYFFFEPNEIRFCSERLRVVRVGTHAVSSGSKATLRQRLRTHRGTEDGGGNHRSSIFRSHVGAALMRRNDSQADFPEWGDQSADTRKIKASEVRLERAVSKIIRQMPVLCLDVAGPAGSKSDRAYIERNSIALLSEVGSRVDSPTEQWLGRSSPKEAIRRSGLWNVNFVNDTTWDPEFLDILEFYARVTAGREKQPSASLAPYGWWDRSASHGQLQLSWPEDVVTLTENS